MSDTFNDKKSLKNISFTLSLLSAVINEENPAEPDFEPDWDFVFNFTASHNLENTVFYAVEKLENKPRSELYKKWRDCRNKCVHRNMIQRQEFARICSLFEDGAIEYMPVKGFAVSGLYPIEDSRFMSDLDILIKKDREKAGEILLKEGYKEKKNESDYDKAFCKPPFMIIELHNQLFPLYNSMAPFFSDIFQSSKKTGCRYDMKDEDFYVYETAHLFKHYEDGGTGIRSVMDFYLINKKLMPKMDFESAEKKLEEIGLREFSEKIEAIAEKWFERADYENFTEDEKYILSSGTYGTREHFVLNKRKNYTKSGYLKNRLFPSANQMKEIFPNLNKRPRLIFFYYIYRLFRALFFRKNKVINEYKILKNESKSKS